MGRSYRAKVGHDRIQQASGSQSIGEAIRYWYGLKSGDDFERIDVEAAIHPDGHFILIPTAVKMRGKVQARVLEKVNAPLSFHRDYQSKFWRQQIERIRNESRSHITWAGSQLSRIVSDHRESSATHILEPDLLRGAGALSLLGLDLGPYLGKGYDCMNSQVQFLSLPIYPCPVEIKKRSRGFTYQVTRYTKLPRALVLCMEHNMVNPPDHIDFVELVTLADYLVR